MKHVRISRRPLVAASMSLAALALVVGLASAAPAPKPPENKTPPAISGTAQQGQTLTASTGNWSGSTPITYAYQWVRCDAQGASCAAIEGATARTRVVDGLDVGRRLRVRVAATNSAGTALALSAATAVVTAAAAPPPGNAVPVESVNLPERLLISQVAFSPKQITSLRQRTSVTVRVTTTRGTPVRGALVFLRSTPLVTNTPPEQPTGGNGTVTFTIVPEADLRLFFRRGYNLQFFVRTRKAGDNPLAGISTRRLVQIPLAP